MAPSPSSAGVLLVRPLAASLLSAARVGASRQRGCSTWLQLGTERSPCSSAVSRILQMTGDSTFNRRDRDVKDSEIIDKLVQELTGLITTGCKRLGVRATLCKTYSVLFGFGCDLCGILTP